MRPNFGALGVILAKKALQKMLRKRGVSPRRKQDPITLAEGSRRQAHYQELFEQETVVRTHVEAIVRVFA